MQVFTLQKRHVYVLLCIVQQTRFVARKWGTPQRRVANAKKNSPFELSVRLLYCSVLHLHLAFMVSANLLLNTVV